MKNKIHFGHLLAISALTVATCAAFFSVFGLSQLFAGASIAVIVMASSLEFSKVVAASFLHKYWGEMGRALKIYLTIGVIVLVTITSAGIYGFLSSAYQKTASNLEIHNGEVESIEGKIAQFKNKVEANNLIIESRNKRVDQLTSLRTSQENRLDNRRLAKATRGDISNSNSEIKSLNENIDAISSENNKLLDSVSKYNIIKLETISASKVAGEVGPLKYLADLSGKPMDSIVNYFILLLVFVFDPLAISLVIGTTWIFEKKRKEGLIKSEGVNDAVSDAVSEGVNDAVSEENNEIEVEDEALEVEDEALEVEDEGLNEGISEGLNEGISEGVNQLSFDFNQLIDEDIHDDIIDDSVDHEDIIVKKEPIITTGKIERKDIKEVKAMERGFSVKIPEAKNSIQRIGSQKIIKENDKNNLIFKRDGN